MAWPWHDEWMTAKECADWWRDEIEGQARALYAKQEQLNLGADNPVGFWITWNAYSISGALDMFLIDPLRLGDGTGKVSVDSRTGAWARLEQGANVLADISRAMAFLPLGRIVRGASVAVGEARVPAAVVSAGIDVRPTMPSPNVPIEIQAGAEQLRRCSGMLRRIFMTSLDSAPGNGICTWAALTKALRKIGYYHVGIDDILRLTGQEGRVAGFATMEHLRGMAPRLVTGLSPVLERLGVRHWEVVLDLMRDTARSSAGGETVESLLHAAFDLVGRGEKGVLIFNLYWTHPTKGAVAHTLCAMRSVAGQLRIFDRSNVVATTLADLGRTYKGIGAARLVPQSWLGKSLSGRGPVWIPQASANLGRGHLSSATAKMAGDATVMAPGAGLFGPVTLPVQLHLGIMSGPFVPRRVR